MKTQKIVLVLLTLLTVSVYATHGPVKGYTSDNCQGTYREFDSYTDLVLAHDEEDENNDNEVWTCGSYIFDTDPEEECHEFEDIPTVKVVGTPLPDWDSDVGQGDSGSGTTIDAPVDYLNDNPGKNFDQEDVDEIVDCLLDAAASNARVANWKGDRTKATWLDETNEKWYPTEDDWYHGKYGETKYVGGNTPTFTTRVYMHGKNMGNTAKQHDIPYKHMLIYWHLHEYVHVLQAEQERNDGDDQFKPSFAYDRRWMRELEAIETVDEWWRALFGDNFDPPFLIPKALENFDSDFNRLVELDAKKQDGTLTEEEKQELEDLESWFASVYDPTQGKIPEAERNTNYKSKQLSDCS